MHAPKPKVVLSVLLGVALSTLLIAFLSPLRQSVEAQNTGTVQLAVRTQSFTFASTTAAQVIGIGSVSQVGHMLNIFFTNIGSGATLCHVVFEGSNNNTIWFLLASAVQAQSLTYVNQPQIYANGYFPYLRVIVNPEGFADCESASLTVNYSGFATAVPINNLTSSYDVTADLAGTTAIAPPNITNVPTGPFIWNGLQCSNSGASAAFIQLFNLAGAPTLGTTPPFYTALVPATGNWAYAGPPIPQTGHNQEMWIAATTTRTGGSTATNVSCQAQINYSGPFYPLTVVQ